MHVQHGAESCRGSRPRASKGNVSNQEEADSEEGTGILGMGRWNEAIIP